MRTKRVTAANAVKSVDLTDRTVEAWISDDQVDRDGEIVVPKAFEKRLETFKANPVLLWMHNPYDVPIGKVLEVEIQERRIGALVQFRDSAKATEIFSAYADGSLTSFSIGFRVHAWEKGYRKEGGEFVPPRITDAELYELSAVTIPSNTRARVKLAGLDFDGPQDLLHDVKRLITALGDARARGEQVDEQLLGAARELRTLMLGVPAKAPVKAFNQEELRAALAKWPRLAG